MSKTRSCRRTPGETAVHERAVKIRKMTDQQINEFFYKQWSDGYEAGKKAVPQADPEEAIDRDYEILAFIEDVAVFPGIGHATVSKMRQVARKRGINVDR